MTFEYTALDPAGKRKSGFLEASTKEAAIDLIAQEGRFVVSIEESERKPAEERKRGGKKVSRSDLSLFTRRLADLSGAGLPLDRCIQVIADQTESETLKDVCLEVLKEVRGGRSVSDSLEMHPKLFNDIYTQTLRAGEASGQFPEVATRLADFQEKEAIRRSQLVSTLAYPAILGIFAVCVIGALLAFVVPRLTSVFNQIGAELPITTRWLMDVSGLLSTKGLYIVIGIAVAIFAFSRWSKTEHGALTKDRMALTLPLVGSIIKKSVVSRYARVLATLVYGGVPILQALELAGLASGNRIFKEKSQTVEAEVREGRPIAAAMRDAGDFPPVLTNMVGVGEETGNLPAMLNRVCDSLDFEVDNGLRRLVAFVEPAIVITMGLVVGVIVISILLPIYQAQDIVK